MVVVCGEPKFVDDGEVDTLLNPTVIIEVLSPSTEAYNRGKKFDHYRTLESLREYILISSDHPQIERFTRQTDSQWLLTVANKPDDVMALESVGCQLKIADVYKKVQFATSAEGFMRPLQS